MQKEKLHIVIIPTWMPSEGNTSGIFTLEQADALVSAGHKVSVLMFQYLSFFTWLKKKFSGKAISAWQKGKLVSPIACNFINLSITRFYKGPLKFQREAFLNYAERTMNAYIKHYGKPDVIHHHEIADFCYITKHLSEKFNIPYILTEHSPYNPDKIHFNRYETKEERLEMIKGAKARIAVSTYYKTKYEQSFGATFIVIPNLVTKQFSEAPLPSLPKPATPFHFISIGSLTPVKGHTVLIRAFALAFKNTSDIKLTIIGEGALRKELENLIASFEMKERISLPGSKTKEELVKLLDQSHVLVVSSEMETFSVAAAENLFRGNPVLSTRCGGPEDFITERNGMLCNVNDVEDMATKLKDIRKKYQEFNFSSIAQEARTRFSEEAVSAQLTSLYRSVI